MLLNDMMEAMEDFKRLLHVKIQPANKPQVIDIMNVKRLTEPLNELAASAYHLNGWLHYFICQLIMISAGDDHEEVKRIQDEVFPGEEENEIER